MPRQSESLYEQANSLMMSVIKAEQSGDNDELMTCIISTVQLLRDMAMHIMAIEKRSK